MPSQPPFRMPCEGIAGKPLFFIGGPFSHSLAPDLRDRYVNTTVVPNYNTDVGGNIPPYERWTQDFSGGLSCEVHHCVTGPDAAPCSQWILPYIANDFDKEGKVDFSKVRKQGFKNVQGRRYWSGVFGFLNKETTDGPDTTQEYGDCPALKKWRGYTAAGPNTKYTTLTITAHDTEEQFNYDESCNSIGTQVNWDDRASVDQNIDPNSGLITVNSLGVSPNTPLNHALGDLTEFGLMSWNGIVGRMTNNTHVVFTDLGHIDCTDNSITVYNDTGGPAGVAVDELLEWNLAAGTFRRRYFIYDASGAQITIQDESFTVSDSALQYNLTTSAYEECGIATTATITVTATLGGENISANIYADIKNLLALWPLNDDALYPWRNDLKVSVAPLVSRDELLTKNFLGQFFVEDFGSPIADPGGATIGDASWSGRCQLIIQPDPNTGTKVERIDLNVVSGDVIDETVDGFSFTTVTGYSFSGTLPPGVSFDSSTGRITGTAGATGHYGITVTITGASPAATGAILGAPKPAGYQNYFDFNYRDWIGCCYRPDDNPGFQTWSWYQVGWGGNVSQFNIAAGCTLPLNATQWTNFFQAVNKPQGAFLFYNDRGQAYYPGDCVSSDAPSGVLDGDALWAGKYAECLELWPSQNFAMPAGDAKFWFDETRVYCAVNVSGVGAGSTWTITDVLGNTPLDSTDFSGIWGGPVTGGFYNVASYSGGTLTLGSKAYDVPSNWRSRSNGDDAKCFGKLRFFGGASLLGRVPIMPDMAGTTFTFANAQPAFGMNSATHTEQVDLWDDDMVPVAGNVAATRVDDSHFTTATAYTKARFATITGTAKWYVNDSGPKGDYAVLEWLADLRSIGEYARLAGITDCSGTQVAQPSTNVGGGPVTQPFASFIQTPGCLPFVPCSPKVVCISPNGETWSNGTTFPFPETFACDELYGSKWWGYVQSTMTDLFWQPPHRPCNIETCAHWQMDGGTCGDDSPGSCPGDDDFESDSELPVYYFAHAPQVEARLTVPGNYGLDQDESAPALPDGIQIGWLSPVTNSTGDVALPPVASGALSDRGEPAGASAAWDLHGIFCAHAVGCRFNYQLPGC